MGKTKRKANLANSTASKKNKSEKLNPFEIRFNREKHSVINRKKSSTVVFKSKTNGKNEAVGRPGIARSRAIQKRKDTLLQEYKIKHKSNIFVDKRIGEKDAELSAEDKMIARFTAERIKGKKSSIFNLGEEENLTHFGQAISELEQFDDDPRSDDEEENAKKMMDAEQNFGGFLNQHDMEFTSGQGNSRKEWIEQMIADSKKKKYEMQKDKEDALKMTQDLDQAWKQLVPNLKSLGSFVHTKQLKKTEDEDANEEDKYDYNKIMKELVFEPKKAKAQERLKTDEEIVQEAKARLEKLEELRLQRMNKDIIEEDSEEESEENVEEDSEENVEEESEEDNDDQDKYSDLEEDSEDEAEEAKSKTEKKANKKSPEVLETEIPFTFAPLKTYEELEALLEHRTSKQKCIILERMIKCNHPQFGGENKSHMENLFTFLLQHVHDSAQDFDLETVNALTPFLFDLAKFSPQPSGEAIRSVLLEKYMEFTKSPKSYPPFESLVFMKIATLLFPTSDYRHPVATPAMQWMSYVLSISRPFCRRGLASGLFVAAILTEAIGLSKKFSPELVNFLTGIVFMAVPKTGSTVIPFVPPFKVVGPESTLLSDLIKTSKARATKLGFNQCISTEPMTEEFAVSALNSSLDLLKVLVELWSNLPSCPEIFAPLRLTLLPNLPVDKLHPDLAAKVQNLVQILSEKAQPVSTRSHTMPKRKKEIKMLKLYDPELDDNFDPFQKSHGKNLSKEKAELAKLNHKLKREAKGARKDLRADTAFLAKQKAKERREKDADRMSRTKAIMAGLGGQEGEFRQLQRQKKKKR